MKIGNLEFSKAYVADCADVKQCARAAYAQYVEVIGKEPAPMCADFLSLIRQGVVSIVKLEDEFAGFVVLYPQHQPDGEASLFIENIAVLPSLTGAGIGAALMLFAEARAKEQLINSLRLYTNAKMTRNLGWYTKLGYVETRRIHEDGFDRVYFEKKLRPDSC